MKKILFFLSLFMPVMVFASEGITDNCNILVNNQSYIKLTDENYKTAVSFKKEDIINITCAEKINYVYIMYEKSSEKGIAIYNDESISVGENNYLHELLTFDNQSDNLTLSYNEDYSISEIYLFNEELPSWVENWQTLKKADLMLFSTHADDEQLFFSGLLPTYVNKGYNIQVVYFTNHFNETYRYHEQLEGLWTVGIKYYPVISSFPDAWSTSLDGALANLEKAGYSYEDAINFDVTLIRKYQPLVVVGHDEKGEYSHGQHILNTDVLKKAIINANDETYTDAENNKPYQISKLYLHLYDKNQIILNYDLPLENFNNKTAYEVSKEGYAKHYSQQYTWFTPWLKGENNEYTKASDIKTYSPCLYGLYYTSVGEDVVKDDMFENVVIPKETIKEKIINITKEINLTSQNNNLYNKIINNKYFGITLCIVSFIILLLIIKGKKHHR